MSLSCRTPVRGGPVRGEQPLVGNWPADDCAFDSFPIATDEPHPALPEGTPQDAFDRLATELAAQSLDARWATGGSTTLSAELGPMKAACYRPLWGAVGASATVGYSTTDGRLDTEFPVLFYFTFAPDGSRYDEYTTDFEPFAIDAFSEASGLAGVGFAATDRGVDLWSRVVIEDSGGEGGIDGIVEVTGYDGASHHTVEALMWCTGSACPGQTPRNLVRAPSPGGGAAGASGML
jgi:hypothetical protein